MYAVIDLETTGLRTGWHDRIVEIAVVHVDELGSVEREWCTLVNPGRDLGPQHIHGIRAAEVLAAPTFEQIAGQLVQLLAGRGVVAHNFSFDGPFLAAEYARLGVQVPLNSHAGLCTMRLAGRFLPESGRGLADCCMVAHIAVANAHSALHDAQAAAALLSFYLRSTGQPPPWATTLIAATQAVWPVLPVHAAAPVSRQQPDTTSEHFLSRLVARLPRVHHPDADAYLELLDRALLDRHVSATEAEALVGFAQQLGLGRHEVVELHERYLAALAAAALEDGVFTDAEHDDLVQVTALLGLEASHLDQALKTAADDANIAHLQLGRFALAPGDIVVFTGQLATPREEWERRALGAGLVPGRSVTKATRLVVAADPDTLSGKARQARKYGIPLVDPDTFLRLTAVMSGPSPHRSLGEYMRRQHGTAIPSGAGAVHVLDSAFDS